MIETPNSGPLLERAGAFSDRPPGTAFWYDRIKGALTTSSISRLVVRRNCSISWIGTTCSIESVAPCSCQDRADQTTHCTALPQESERRGGRR